MKKVLKRKTMIRIIIFLSMVIIIIHFFGGYEAVKEKTVKKISSKTQLKKKTIRLIKYNQFNYRKVRKNSIFYLETDHNQWSGWIDAKGMKYNIQSISKKSHLAKYKNGIIDTFLLEDIKPSRFSVFRLKSLSKFDKDTLLVRIY